MPKRGESEDTCKQRLRSGIPNSHLKSMRIIGSAGEGDEQAKQKRTIPGCFAKTAAAKSNALGADNMCCSHGNHVVVRAMRCWFLILCWRSNKHGSFKLVSHVLRQKHRCVLRASGLQSYHGSRSPRFRTERVTVLDVLVVAWP